MAMHEGVGGGGWWDHHRREGVREMWPNPSPPTSHPYRGSMDSSQA